MVLLRDQEMECVFQRRALSFYRVSSIGYSSSTKETERERHKNKRVFLRELKQLREVRDSDRDKKLKDARSQR